MTKDKNIKKEKKTNKITNINKIAKTNKKIETETKRIKINLIQILIILLVFSLPFFTYF